LILVVGMTGEDGMAQDFTKSVLDMFNKFGGDLSLPKLDVERMVEAQRKNIDALGRASQAASEGAQALAVKQREILETAFRETTQAVRDFKPMGNPTEVVAKQSEFARKAFEAALQNTRDVAELAKKAVGDPATIIKDRMQENLNELREAVSRQSGAAKA
jgi:phasin family protein